MGEITLARGKWFWNDEKQSLEFQQTGNISSAGGDKLTRKNKFAKQSHNEGRARFSELGATHSAGVRPRSSKGREKNKVESENDNVISIADIKVVALSMMQKASRQTTRSPWFEELFQSQQLDDFLMSLLLYFHWFFEKRSLDIKHYPENVNKSRKDIEDYILICEKIQITEKFIGKSYCALILGRGIEDNHHMMAGESRVSATHLEREMFEKLYSFCSYVIWLTFKRRDFDLVEKEIGRLLRSQTFNLSTRVKNFTPPEKDENGKIIETKLTPAEHRRLNPKRPSINAIIHQRSPVLVSIMPRPREDANWLFTGKKDFEKLSNDSKNALANQLEDPVKYGILGDLLSLYNPETLAPEGANEGEADEEKRIENTDSKEVRTQENDKTMIEGIVNGEEPTDGNVSP